MSCPNFLELSLERCDGKHQDFWSIRVPEFIQQPVSKLEDLFISFSSSGEVTLEERLARWIGPQLQSLTIDWMELSYDRLKTEVTSLSLFLVPMSSSLESLSLRGLGFFPVPSSTQGLVLSMPNLKSLQIDSSVEVVNWKMDNKRESK